MEQKALVYNGRARYPFQQDHLVLTSKRLLLLSCSYFRRKALALKWSWINDSVARTIHSQYVVSSCLCKGTAGVIILRTDVWSEQPKGNWNKADNQKLILEISASLMKGIPASMSQLAKLPKWLERSMELNDLSDL